MGDYNTVKVLNTFFSNIVNNLNIAEYSNCEPLAKNISDLVLKCVVKYRNHPAYSLYEKYSTNIKTAIFLFIDK